MHAVDTDTEAVANHLQGVAVESLSQYFGTSFGLLNAGGSGCQLRPSSSFLTVLLMLCEKHRI